jgi:hypothetical protein
MIEEFEPPTSIMNEWRKHCNCDERFSPCDGVMSGGLCDDLHDDEDDDWMFDASGMVSDWDGY